MTSLSKRFLDTAKDGETVPMTLSEMIQKQMSLRQDHPFNDEQEKQKVVKSSKDVFNAWNMKSVVETSREYHELAKQSDLSLLDRVEHPADIDPTAEPNFTEAGQAPETPTDTPAPDGELGELLESQPTPEEIAEQEKQALIKQMEEQAEQTAAAKFEEGIAEGIIKGNEQAKQELAEQFNAIAGIMNSLQAVNATEMGHFRATLEKSIKDIIFDLVAVKIDEFPEIIANRITTALDQFTEDINGIHLTLHPADWEILQQDTDFMTKVDGLVVRTNQRLRRGGCILKSDNMEINATLDHQLNVGEDFGKPPSPQQVAEAHQQVENMLENTGDGAENETLEPVKNEINEPAEIESAEMAENEPPADDIPVDTPIDTPMDDMPPVEDSADIGEMENMGEMENEIENTGETDETQIGESPDGAVLDLSNGFPEPETPADDLDGFDPYAEPDDPFADDEPTADNGTDNPENQD